MPGSDNRLFKRTNTRIKILIIGEIMKVYDGTLDYILLKVSHLLTRPALSFSGRKFTFKASYLSDNTEWIMIPSSAFNVYTLLTLKLLERFTFSCCSHLTCSRQKAAKLGFSCQQSVPQIQKGSSFLVQALIPIALDCTDSQMQFDKEFAPSGEALWHVWWHRMSWTAARHTVENRSGFRGSLKRWFTKRIPFISEPSSSETIDLPDTKYMGKRLVRLRKDRTQTNEPNQTPSQTYETKPTEQKRYGWPNIFHWIMSSL